MAALRSRCGHYIFVLCEFRMQVWNVLHVTRCKYKTQKIAKNSSCGHHRTTLLGYIFASKARIDNREKNMLNSNISPTRPYSMVKFGPLAAEIVWLVSGTQQISTGFRVLAALLHGTLVSGRQPNFAALNRGCQLYSAGRPSRWAWVHILVTNSITKY